MSKKELSWTDTLSSLNLYINNYIESKKLHPDCRTQNFPDYISENITKFIINKIQNLNCINSKIGDLEIINDNEVIKVEVKCFTSKGPSSFGPKEKWNLLYFLDATDFINYNFKLYCILLDNIEFSKIKVNKTTTFLQQAEQGKRPRISFNNIIKQIQYTTIFNGNIKNLHIENINNVENINNIENEIIKMLKNYKNKFNKNKIIQFIKKL